MNLFENNFADIIKLRSYWIRIDPKSNITCIFLRVTDGTQRHKGKCHGMTRVDRARMKHRVKGPQGLPASPRAFLPHLGFRLPASRVIVLRTPVNGTLFWQSWKIETVPSILCDPHEWFNPLSPHSHRGRPVLTLAGMFSQPSDWYPCVC